MSRGMRRFLPLMLIAVAAFAPAAFAEVPTGTIAVGPSGGAAVPAQGAARYGETPPPVPRRPRLTLFKVTKRSLPSTVTFRLRGSGSSGQMRLALLPAKGRKAIKTVKLGRRKAGRLHTVAVSDVGLRPGRYRLRISGARLRVSKSTVTTIRVTVPPRPKPAPTPPPPDAGGHVFPVRGPYTFGGADARFGTKRSGHTHQGQDVPAAEGTPVVAPYAGRIEAVRYQAGGAGHYVVLDGAGEDRDYVFMHFQTGSTVVTEGQTVSAGQRLGNVGNTGASFGAHLHFEVWVGGGWYTGGHPIDPLPLLMAWAGR
jgi:murein DD-endopeptidase MepM/ murein hydrolase activator NlpD